MNTELYLVRFLALALAFCKLFLRVAVAEGEVSEEDDIIKDCNGILYRLMVDSGEPPFPNTACDVKQVRTAWRQTDRIYQSSVSDFQSLTTYISRSAQPPC